MDKALELADELENALDTDSWCQECALETTEPVARQAATMLRQQQAEIEALKTCLIVEQEHNERMVEDRSKYEAQEK
jgi:Na+-translocating ferredoxin:NAD+ oxidoreductase RnfC subunit